MSLPVDRALAILSECTGDDIWSVEHCQLRRVPPEWIERLADAFESGYRTDSETIYVPGQDNRPIGTNQYHGLRDVDLAVEVARALNVDVDRILASLTSRRRIVQAIKDAVFDGE